MYEDVFFETIKEWPCNKVIVEFQFLWLCEVYNTGENDQQAFIITWATNPQTVRNEKQ